MKVSIPQLNKVLSAQAGDNLFKVLRAADIPVASSCLGDGICGKCRLTITQGPENLSEILPLEQKLIDKYQLAPKQRISCQSQIFGDIEVTSTYW
jgi:ferredoxin, 2Fe-2S